MFRNVSGWFSIEGFCKDLVTRRVSRWGLALRLENDIIEDLYTDASKDEAELL